MGILSLLLWTPALGALLLAFVPGQFVGVVRGVAHLFSIVTFLLCCTVIIGFDPQSPEIQMTEHAALNPKLGSAYALGVDGLSIPLLGLASLLTCVAILASTGLTEWVKGYHICILVLEFGMLGVFLSQDWSIFYIFWELTLTPLFFLINRWGGKRRHAASLNFVLYTMGGSVFMLLSMVAIYQNTTGHGTLMNEMGSAARLMPEGKQILIFLGFLVGFGVKLPIFPLHGWLPLAHVEAPSPISILLSGIMLKMGAYGLLRVVGMMPQTAMQLQPLLEGIAFFGMLYGGLLAWRQTDLKAMVAYSSISHMGIVLLGIATLNEIGISGAVLQMVAHGLIAGALFLLVGLLYERTHTRNIQDYSSLIQVMPRFTIFMTLTLFAAMGLPGSIGFIAELHTFIGGLHVWGGWMALLSVTMLISAAYAVRTIAALFTGPVKPAMQSIPDLRSYELIAASLLVGGIYWFGFLPSGLAKLSSTAVTAMTQSESSTRE